MSPLFRNPSGIGVVLRLVTPPVVPVAPPVTPVAPPVTPVAPPVTPVAPMPPPVNSAPLMHRPVLSTRSRSQVPAAKITVLQRPAVPTMDPMMVF